MSLKNNWHEFETRYNFDNREIDYMPKYILDLDSQDEIGSCESDIWQTDSEDDKFKEFKNITRL